MTRLELGGDLIELTRALCDIRSESGDEAAIADAVEAALREYAHLEVLRDGDAVVARTSLGLPSRVVIAGHLDTVPIADNLPTRLVDGVLWGRGAVDMKAGVAVQLALAAALDAPTRDITWVFYDHEEVAADLNGLGRLVANHPDWLAADFAVLGEPTNGGLEGGCNGTLRAEVRLAGVAAHSARAWMGVNAIHAAGEVLRRLEAYEPRTVPIDGLNYRESLNAVLVSGGTAANVIPDGCVVTVNYRFAPSATPEQAEEHVRELFDGYDVVITDSAPGARPGLDAPAAQEFAAAVLGITGGAPAPKFGWTDVARFSALGVPAVNFGPGDPLLAHKVDERCPVDQIHLAYRAQHAWLTA
ncbi:succinyl-diaminopimelate desuccinylase [Cellulomonas rhizosphaerae]|uniref:Succinyl-diaminopimelate desuccinylase n=1 Tax=Cellulomonas rhizosphaerae TaxID=2293719 RepID=A0A413RKH2_9CELL|nr:succinyl-diaminopimelate desuccinylase [Cellulomonas rhizosphaerae]RHA39643.1 succinyl-diaminopimelate desuccinylase [Cellulomonas rhizosphaerae]